VKREDLEKLGLVVMPYNQFREIMLVRDVEKSTTSDIPMSFSVGKTRKPAVRKGNADTRR
jgi:hypothetical protein